MGFIYKSLHILIILNKGANATRGMVMLDRNELASISD